MIDIPSPEKAQIFLECYGNCFVREKTSELIKSFANDLIQYVVGVG